MISQTAGDVEALFAEYRSAIDQALISIAGQATELMPDSLSEVVRYALTTKGKRLRPILVLLAWRAATGRDDVPVALIRLACSLEVIHTYSLVHDDLPCMDDDDMRRGRPTAHRVYGVPKATVAGAALLPVAVRLIRSEGAALGLPDQVQRRLIVELTSASGAAGMVGGQYMDLQAESRPIDGSELESIHRLKTGALLTAALRIGAIAGDCDATLLSDLTTYGQALGLAFQIADDVLDVEGDSDALGKTAGRDQALAKASYPALHGLEGARALARARIDEAKAAIAGRDQHELDWVADFVIHRRK